MVAIAKDKAAPVAEQYIYPEYSREECIADGTIHFLGIAGSIIAFSLLFSQTTLNPRLMPALSTYAVTVIALFCLSAAYHMTPWPDARPLLRRFDQSAIYFKIAGTYTPLVFVVDTTFAYSLLTVIWVAAAVGSLVKLITGDRLNRHTVVIYLGLAWSSVLLLWPLLQTLDLNDVMFVVFGGVLYTIGVYYHQSEGKFANAIWHAFVLTASCCHFVAIADAAIRYPV